MNVFIGVGSIVDVQTNAKVYTVPQKLDREIRCEISFRM